MVRPTLAIVMLIALTGCSQVISLTQYNYPPRPADAEVIQIDARNMERPEVQRIFDEYDVIARFHKTVRSGDRYEADVASKVEDAESTVRNRGGHAVLFTENSEMIAAILQDVAYAGPDDRLIMYVLRRKEE